MQPNIGWLFYKDYFRFPESMHKFVPGLLSSASNEKKEERDSVFMNFFKLKNEKIFALKLSDYKADNSLQKLNAPHFFELKTIYPGMLLGSGYQHEVGAKGEIKIGFFFDHTTGMPIIPGSSVKGVLRSVFPTVDAIEKYKKRNIGQRTRYIREQLKSIGIQNTENIPIDELEMEMFEGMRKNAKGEYEPISIYDRDIFFDVTIAENQTSKFLADDYITPHDEASLKNPIPLQFLKILPEIKFKFQFNLKNSEIVKELTSAKKLELFTVILKDIGIGAKTNVGYGKFK